MKKISCQEQCRLEVDVLNWLSEDFSGLAFATLLQILEKVIFFLSFLSLYGNTAVVGLDTLKSPSQL